MPNLCYNLLNHIFGVAMKKNLLKFSLVSMFVVAALAVTGCKPKDKDAGVEQPSKKTETVKDPVDVKDIPSSGAKTYITTQTGASNFVKNIGNNVDFNQLLEEGQSVIDLEKVQDQIEELYYDSSYADLLESLVKSMSRSIEQAVRSAMETGSVDLNIDEHPGAASDFPEGYALDIPNITIKAKGSVNDVNDPTSGSGEASVNTAVKVMVDNIKASIPEFSVNANVNFTSDPIKQALKGEGTVGEKFSFAYEMDGAKLKINAFNNDVNIRGDYDGSKGSANVNLKDEFSSEIELDAAKLGVPSSPVKYLKSVATVKGNLDGNPAMNSDQSFRGNLNYDYEIASKTGMSFAGADGVGGKVIGDVKLNFKGTFNLAEIFQLKSILSDLGSDLFGGMKLTEEEFNGKSLPFSTVVSVKFYDDNNKETLDFLNLKSSYEFYSLVYDYVSGMDTDAFDDLFYELEDLLSDLEDLF